VTGVCLYMRNVCVCQFGFFVCILKSFDCMLCLSYFSYVKMTMMFSVQEIGSLLQIVFTIFSALVMVS